MDLGIAGKWALVGGASKGLGWGCARALALEGVNVVMVARGAELLNQSVADLRVETGGQVQLIGVAVDITTEAGRDAIWNVPGGPGKDYDIVVTNAGGPPPGDFRDWDRDAWIKAIDGNMLTPIEFIKACKDELAALNLCMNLSNLSDEAIRDTLGIDKGHFSRLRKGRGNFPAQKRIALMQLCGNRAPVQYEAHRLNCELVDLSKEAVIRELEQQLQQLRMAA